MSTHGHHAATPTGAELNRLATSATNHCLTGCVIGEVLGMTIATALGWGDVASIALAVALAFLFGYSLTSIPLFRARLPLAAIVPIAHPVRQCVVAEAASRRIERSSCSCPCPGVVASGTRGPDADAGGGACGTEPLARSGPRSCSGSCGYGSWWCECVPVIASARSGARRRVAPCSSPRPPSGRRTRARR